MNIVLLRHNVSEEELQLLMKEFPQFVFIAPLESQYPTLTDEIWSQVEVLFTDRLNADDLKKASRLRWIHCPSSNTTLLCVNEIAKKSNILLTHSKDWDTIQISEFVMGGVLAFAKNLFDWKTLQSTPERVWASKYRNSMWNLEGRTFLQVGLSGVGTQITELAKVFRMNIIGVQKQRSFHPNCKTVFVKEELSSLLPRADIVSLALPKEWQKERWLKQEELKLMKEDSILIVLGSKQVIDLEALEAIAVETKKFRGIILDSDYSFPVHESSVLWKIPDLIITPEVASRPKTSQKELFRLFRHNLRQYIHNNFSDMQVIV